VFEDQLRAQHADSARYWEADVELDLVRLEGDVLVVSEVKWAPLTKAQRQAALVALEARFGRTQLAKRHLRARFEVLDGSALRGLA
jgi:hypothetical protein